MVATSERETFAPYAERELLAHYSDATPEHVRRGREWYAEARRECRRIARRTGVSYGRVAAVLAITSPDAQLTTNVRWTEEICLGQRTAGRYPKDQAPKVAAALASNRPGRHATGPKVSAFYRAIMGDTDGLVIDRWAAFAAGGQRDAAPSAKQRRAMKIAYRSAAARVGETVRDFQAIVWLKCRETTVNARGLTPKLADITA